MSIKKQLLKSKPVCKVTFRVSAEESLGADSLQVLGNFNEWDKNAEPMKKLKSGEFTTTIELDADSTYEFRYLTNSGTWITDEEADGFTDNGIGDRNSLIITK